MTPAALAAAQRLASIETALLAVIRSVGGALHHIEECRLITREGWSAIQLAAEEENLLDTLTQAEIDLAQAKLHVGPASEGGAT